MATNSLTSETIQEHPDEENAQDDRLVSTTPSASQVLVEELGRRPPSLSQSRTESNRDMIPSSSGTMPGLPRTLDKQLDGDSSSRDRQRTLSEQLEISRHL